MKKRSPVSVLLLSMFTFGIYDIYWLVKTKKELNNKTRVHVPSIWLLFAPTLILLAISIVFFVIVILAQLAARSGSASSTGGAVFGILVYLIWFLVITINVAVWFYWFWKFSKAVGQYTQNKMSTGVTFLLLCLLRFVGIAIIQDEFNDMIELGQAAAPAMQSYVNGAPLAAAMPAPTTPEPSQIDPSNMSQPQA